MSAPPTGVDPNRSALMKRVRRAHTAPELAVRRALHGMGFRFRLHPKDLPGTPDLVLPRHRVAVFVHGCFWHRHPRCKRATIPKTRADFWSDKFRSNVQRDERKARLLKELGWRVVTIWECETLDREVLSIQLSSFLGR
jgi:DNA mismatch endonuclease (patch repair protein)